MRPLLLLLAAGALAAEKGEVDNLRDNVIEAIKDLRFRSAGADWNAQAKALDLTPGQMLISEFPAFAADIIYEGTPKELDVVWLWARVGSKARVTRGMYSSLARSAKGHRDPLLYQKQWDAIADNSLDSAAEALNYTHEAVTNGRLYRMLLREHMENKCNIQQSPKQLLYNLYNSLQMSQLKAYTLMQFSLLYRKVRDNNTDYTEESQAYQKIYEEYLTRQAQSLKEVMNEASNEYWRCDPKQHILDETYTTLKKFLQGYLQNEVDMNPEQGCWENCDYYQVTKQYSCFKDTYCSKQTTCQGQLVNCKFVDSDMWVCPSASGRNQNRRYEWIKYENGRTLGEVDGTCRRGVTKVDSWWRYLLWHCSYCFCICDEKDSPYTERYFSLKTVMSDIANNKVLTGIKMVKENKVIHLQGQESELLPGGLVNVSNTRWIPIETVTVKTDREGNDYHKVSWQQRALDLDDLTAPEDHILTGIRWRTLGGHLNFEIKACKFDFEKGKLDQGGQTCQWISNDNTDVSEINERKQLKLQSPDLPIRIHVPSQLISSSDKYIQLTHSDEVADASQTAVPFFDLQPVAPDPPTPLRGAGIGYKGLIRSGGFIMPKVFTLDPTPYITTDFTANKDER